MTTTEKVRKRVFYYLLAVVCATAFFAHESFEVDSTEVTTARAQWLSEKKKRVAAFDQMKRLNYGLADGLIDIETFKRESQKNVANHRLASEKTQQKHDILTAEKAKQRFFEFPSAQRFFGEFWAIGLLIYALFNIFDRFLNRKDNWKEKVMIDGAILYCGLYYTVYLFIPTQDFHPTTYKLSLLLTTMLLIISVSQLIRVQKDYKAIIRSLFNFIGKEIEDKDYIKDELKDDFATRRIELINKAVGND